MRADELVSLGQAQYGDNIQITGQRGEIETADGFSLAANQLNYTVFANPKEVENDDLTANALSPILQVDSASISALLSLDRFWVSLSPAVTNDTKNEIDKLKLPGVGFEEKYTRFYPEASMAATLLGFVGKDANGEDQGYFGLEGFYDRQLKGKSTYETQINDAFGRPILAKLENFSGDTAGRTLVLHIDRAVQYMMEDELQKGMQLYGAQSVTAAAIDPKTGGIIAMASLPSFDPRTYQDYSDDLFLNPFISDTYEPGSTFKPLVMATAIDKGLVTPYTKCNICSGPVPIGGYEIHTWNDEYAPNIDMIHVIQDSDNTGMTFVGEKLGLSGMEDVLQRFGFNDLTGIDLQGEGGSDIKSTDNWYPIDVATSSFGQGIAVTPIQLLTAFASLANDGKRMEPHVVDKIITSDGQTIVIPPKVLGQTVSMQTARVMNEILVNAVNNGEASFARLKGYRIAGKTGTAQIPVAGHYDPTKTIASFIGYAPADDPKFVMLVIVNRPTSSIYGSETAAPIFFSLAQRMLNYYGIAPTE
ncbi:MAG TPA: penicillin-binding protein 2 [Patescibacteria group bacterium]|nr:penicillin-binding protein 2 [Patescibacteria group bacterium]